MIRPEKRKPPGVEFVSGGRIWRIAHAPAMDGEGFTVSYETLPGYEYAPGSPQERSEPLEAPDTLGRGSKPGKPPVPATPRASRHPLPDRPRRIDLGP